MVRHVHTRQHRTVDIDFTYSALSDVDEPLSPAGVQRKVDAIGFGGFQVAVILLCAGVFFSEGSQLMVMGPVATQLHDHWNLPPSVRALLVSAAHLGYFCGCLISGIIGDRLGRRPCVLLSYITMGGLGFASASAPTEIFMLLYRFGTGMGCGIGIPAALSLLSEVCPCKHRADALITMASFIVLGELFASASVLVTDPHLDRSGDHCDIYLLSVAQEADHQVCSWRNLLKIAATPSLFMIMFALTMLWESPQFVTVRHRDYQEVNRILKTVRKSNGAYHVPIRFTPDSSSVQEQPFSLRPNPSTRDVLAFQTLTGRHYTGTLWTMVIVTGCKDFCLYGLAYILLQYFNGIKSISIGLQLVLASSLAIPGILFALLLGNCRDLGHVTTLQVTGFICALCGLGMLQLSYMPDWMGSISAYILKATLLAYHSVASCYTAEVFPTNCRMTAIGLVTGTGRLIGLAAPVLLELSKESSRKSLEFFITMTVILMLAATTLIGINLIWETKQLPLVAMNPEEASADMSFTSYQRVAEAQTLLNGNRRIDKRTSYSSTANGSCSIVEGA
ncbi:hypothetical protein FOL47_005062 [Perkinsus chesapeaki]|uniref:Major facilitator superfamily (MFS) profile domain-containing protein n=1 Tax=Perkinsus chesapeaki TaxID=330153 RepID=A0A7J6LZA4_PERCH|nr:hypothetical protein FOL47_005062 [Perkinsus chesapeaki]